MLSFKRKAAFPFKAGNLEKTASNDCQNNTKKPSKRQQVKRFIVWLAVHGLMPYFLADLILRKGGLSHD